MTQPVCMRAIPQYHLILTKTARYLCLRGHESALCRGIGQFKSYKSILFAKLKLLTYHLYATQFPRPPKPFKSALSGLWKICRVCVWLFKSMKGFRIQKRPLLHLGKFGQWNSQRNLYQFRSQLYCSYSNHLAIKQSKFEYRITICYLFMKIWSNRCQETANVTKVPYLLDVTNDYFSVFFREAGMINTIKLCNSAIAMGDSSFRFIRCNQNGSGPKIWWITTLMRFAYRGIWTGDWKILLGGLLCCLVITEIFVYGKCYYN